MNLDKQEPFVIKTQESQNNSVYNNFLREESIKD